MYRKTDWAPVEGKQHFKVYVPLSFEPAYFKRINTEESVEGSDVSSINSDGEYEKIYNPFSVISIPQIIFGNKIGSRVVDINFLL